MKQSRLYLGLVCDFGILHGPVVNFKFVTDLHVYVGGQTATVLPAKQAIKVRMTRQERTTLMMIELTLPILVALWACGRAA